MTRRPLAPGDVIHGHSDGAFGDDHFDCARIEAVGPDWIVARTAAGTVVFAAGRSDLSACQDARGDCPDAPCRLDPGRDGPPLTTWTP